MKMSQRLQLLSCGLLAYFGSALSMIAIAAGPSNVTVTIGQDALLTCRIQMKGRTPVYWFRSSTGTRISSDWRVDPGKRPAAGEYLIEGDPNSGDINLKITQVQAEDAGQYQCGYDQRSGFVSAGAFLIVLVPPRDNFPECVQPDSQTLAVGETVRLMCLSHGGSPPAKLIWTRDGTVLTDGQEYKNEYEVVLGLSDLNVQFVCRAESPALSQPRTCTTSITVDEPVLTIQPYTYKAEVGEAVTFLCSRQDRPFEARFRWYFRGDLIIPSASSRFNISDYNRSFRINRVEEADSGAMVQCKVALLPEVELTARGVLFVTLLTGEVPGTHPPPRLRTNLPDNPETSSNADRGDVLTAATGMVANDDSKQSRDSTAMIVVLGAGGGLLVVIVGVVVNYLFIRRSKNKNNEPKPERGGEIRSVGSGISLMTKKPSDKSLSSSDSIRTNTTTTTTTTTACKKEVHSSLSNKSKHGSHYAELDTTGVRLSEYQGLNSPPITIYAEPIISPTKLVPRPQHQDGFHDYALPDILPEPSPDEYVEPDPPPRNKKSKQQQQQQQKEQEPTKTQQKQTLQQQNTDGVYIEIIA